MKVKPQEPKAWSYTALTGFETCARRHYILRVAKLVTEPEGEALKWGNEVHKAIENRIMQGTILPKNMQNFTGIVDKLLNTDAQVIAEQQLAVNKDLEPVEWFAKDVWCRGVIDAAVFKDGTAVLIDWKTGKMKPEMEQLKLFAALAFAHYPEIHKVKTVFAWLKDNKVTAEVFTRSQEADIWNEFSARVARFDNAFTSGKWPAKPSGLCKRWCPVGKQHCEFCG